MIYYIVLFYTIQIKCSERQQYRDAFTLQKVEYNDVKDFNYVAGMVPFIRDLIMDVSVRAIRI